ncbi:MAG: hypothetical protein Q4E75_06170 [bacterium]|nr:hypothetical protein [bacterium]
MEKKEYVVNNSLNKDDLAKKYPSNRLAQPGSTFANWESLPIAKANVGFDVTITQKKPKQLKKSLFKKNKLMINNLK